MPFDSIRHAFYFPKTIHFNGRCHLWKKLVLKRTIHTLYIDICFVPHLASQSYALSLPFCFSECVIILDLIDRYCGRIIKYLMLNRTQIDIDLIDKNQLLLEE